VSIDQPIAGYDVASGPLRGVRFSLYANRLVLHGGDATETIPLVHLASVRVAFERDARKLHWAIALGVVALVFAVSSGPLQAWMAELSSKVAASAGRESLEAVLLAVFAALGHLARLMSPVALLLAAGAVALLVFFWLGHTTLTLAFAATERSCSVRGRNAQLVDFADLLGERLAERKG
jgi:uncharacterized Tic20 family protein